MIKIILIQISQPWFFKFVTADGTVPHKRCVTQWLHDCNATEIDHHDTSLQLPRFELVLYKSCTAVARWSIRRHITVVTTALRNPRKSTCGPTGLDGVKVPQIGCISTGRVYFQGRVPFNRSGAFPQVGCPAWCRAKQQILFKWANMRDSDTLLIIYPSKRVVYGPHV